MISTNDDLLKMFFDEDFVPQAYVDILLSSFQTSQLDTLKSSCSTLLSRMDYYTGNLTRELETTIQKLQKPAELILYSSNEGQQGTTKLEYYLDTLSNSVSSLELDVHRIKTELEEMNKQYESSNAITNTLAKLTVAKTHLLSVKKYFDSLKSIAVISIQDDVEKLASAHISDGFPAGPIDFGGNDHHGFKPTRGRLYRINAENRCIHRVKACFKRAQ